MYHQNTLKIFSSQYVGMFVVFGGSCAVSGGGLCTYIGHNYVLEFDIVPMSTKTLLVFPDFFIYFDIVIRVKSRQ